jgi:PAS domain S-box-containing protein
VAASILVVEDEPVVALDLRTRLTRMGYLVSGMVARGEDAVEFAGTQRPDLILMDIRLRGAMDGISAAEQIRHQFGLPVIYLTAHADEATVERARITEPFGYILKPFDERELRTVIEMALYKYAAERKLRESERRYATTLSSIGDAVIATDPKGRVTFMNPVAEQLTGWTLAEASESSLKTVFNICTEVTRASVENPIDRVLAEGIVVGLANHTILISRDGREFPIDDCAAPILDDHGNLSGAVLVFRDVSEAHRLNEHLRNSQKMEALGQLAGGIAHDFNNMLTIILNYTELLLNTAGTDHPWSTFLAEIHRAGMRSADLTRQLLTFCRRQLVEPQNIDLNDAILRTEQMLRRIIGEHIELTVRLEKNLGNVRMDPGQLERILVNLCINARDAMGSQGNLLIESFNTTVDADDIPGLSAGTYRCLRVKDDGHGIPPAIQSRIFEPFFTTKPPGKGTGLGLSSVYGIVQQCGGCITLDSDAGQGATFVVYLPAATGATVTEQQLGNLAFPGGTETILLVEDESTVRKLSQHILRSCGYTVLEAENGAEAIEIARQHAGQIDIVVTDIVMPIMGARKMLQVIQPYLSNNKVILLSGYSDEDHITDPDSPLEATFIQKPFTIAELTTTVRRVLDDVAESRKAVSDDSYR